MVFPLPARAIIGLREGSSFTSALAASSSSPANFEGVALIEAVDSLPVVSGGLNPKTLRPRSSRPLVCCSWRVRWFSLW